MQSVFGHVLASEFFNSLSLTDPEKGEQIAQACAEAWLRKLSRPVPPPWLLVVDHFQFAPAYEAAGAALAPGSRLVRKAIWPVW
jgi:hypothetical protein